MIGLAAKPGTAVLPICSIVSTRGPRAVCRLARSCSRSPAMPDCNLRPQSTRRHIVPCKLSDSEFGIQDRSTVGRPLSTPCRPLFRVERGSGVGHEPAAGSTVVNGSFGGRHQTFKGGAKIFDF